MDLENLEIQNIYFLSDEEENKEYVQMRAPKRYIRDGQNPFEFFNDWEFERFRFSKNSIMFGILSLIKEGLARTNNRGTNISCNTVINLFTVLYILNS